MAAPLFAVAAAIIATLEASAAMAVAIFALKFAAIAAATYIAGKIFAGRAPNFSVEQQERKHLIRSAIAPWRIIYGETCASGVLAFAGATDGEPVEESEVEHGLKVQTLVKPGAAIITLYAPATWNPHNTVDLTIEQDTTFTITGDGQTYTVQAAATAINLGDSENRYKIDLSISPVLQEEAAADTETSLNFTETVRAQAGTKKKYMHVVVILASHECQEIGDVYFGDKIPHELPITESIPASQGIIVSTRPHALATGDHIWIAGHTGSDPDINGKHTVTVIDSLNFTIPVEITTGGTGGTFKNYRFYGGNEAETPYFRISKHLGTEDQEADADLINEVAAWNSARKLSGLTYLYARLRWDIDVWPTGFPMPIKGIVKGKLLYDSRTRVEITSSVAGSPTTINATGHGLITGDKCRIELHEDSTPSIDGEYRVIRINDNSFTIPIATSVGGTGGYSTKVAWSRNYTLCARDYLDSEYGENCEFDEIDDDYTDIAADASDEQVELFADWDSGTEYVSGNRVKNGGKVYRCTATNTNQEPPNVAYWQLEVGDGYQARYTCDGSYTLDMTPREIMLAIATAGAAPPPIWTGGEYRIFAGAFRTSTLSLGEDDIRGPIQIRPRVARQDLYNAVRGVYTDPLKNWEPTGFPPVTNSFYEAQDNGEQIFKDIELPFTQNDIAAQRVATIIINKSRQGITAVLPCFLKAYQITCLDTITLTIDKVGWDAKIFQVMGWEIGEDGGIIIEIQEEAEACYDWNLGQALLYDPAPDTNLPSPSFVDPPTDLTLTEAVYREGDKYLSKIICTWTAGREYSIVKYLLEGSILGSDVWIHIADPTTNIYEIKGVPRGQYSIRVASINLYGNKSDWTSANITVYGVNTILTSAALRPPLNPQLFFSSDLNGLVSQIRLRCRYEIGAGGVPDGIAVLFALTEYKMSLELGADNNTSLVISGGEIYQISQSSPTDTRLGPILAGSTKKKLIVTTLADPFPLGFDSGGHFWCWFSGSQARKVSSYDATTVYFDELFDIDPTPGLMVDYVAAGWADNRDPDNRLIYLRNNGSYEIIKWGRIYQTGGVATFEDCVRAQEGTSKLDVSGLTALYYPAPASGTQFIDFPINSFREVSGEIGVYEASQNVAIVIPPGFWGAAAIAAYARVDRGLVRSYIVPLTYGGAYV